MSTISDNAMHVWVNGEDITQARLEQNRKVLQTAINDNQSQISAMYTNPEIDQKVNTAASTTKVIQAGTVFPSSGLVDGQEFYRDDLHIMYIYDAALNKWVDRGATALQGFKNLLDPSKQSFSRASNATRKDLTPVPFNVLRTEQGRYGQGAFIEESTTNLPYNTDFETFTGTATVFSDAMTAGTTADPAWTVQSGSFTWSTSGATSGATGAFITAGNGVWKPLTGSNGSVLPLTAQATITTPATVPGDGGAVFLWQDTNNGYYANVNNSQFVLGKKISGTLTNITTVAQTISANTTYTITLSITPSGGLTAKLYSGATTGGTLLQTLTTTDTSLTGGFLIGVGGDSGVIVSHASVSAPFADGWTIAGDQRVAWALTSSAISGNYSLSVVGAGNGISGWLTSASYAVTNGVPYTLSVYGTTNNATAYALANNITASQLKANLPSNGTNQRAVATVTSTSTSTQVGVELDGTGTAIFDAIQLEQKAYATSFVSNPSVSSSATRNADSLSYTLSNPLPSRYFGALIWTPEQASGVALSNGNDNRTLFYARSRNNQNWRYLVGYYPADSTLRFYKSDMGGTTISVSIPISFNVHDRISIFFEDDPTTAQQINLWVGVNSGSLSNVNSASTTSITDIQGIDIGCRTVTGNAGFEANGTIDFPIITDTIPTADQVQALYQASDWGGDRNYPGVLPDNVRIGSNGAIKQLSDGSMSLESNKGLVVVSAKGNSTIASNAYYDASTGSWYSYDKNKGSAMIFADANQGGIPTITTANATTGAISWATYRLLQSLSGGYKVQSGSVSVTVATAGNSNGMVVTFPTAFSSAPIMSLASFPQTGNAGYVTVQFGAVTATSANISVNSYIAQTIIIHWTAIGS